MKRFLSIRACVILLLSVFAAVMLYDAVRDATSYYRKYAEWKRTAALSPPPTAKIGESMGPGLPPLHRSDVLDFPANIDGLNTVQGRYVVATDGFGAKSNEYMHVDALATASDFDIVALNDGDISTQKPGGDASFLITPKRDGFLALSVRSTTYRIDPKTGRRAPQGFHAIANLTVLVDEPFLSVPWFEAHPFAKDTFFAFLPLLLGFFAGRLFETRT